MHDRQSESSSSAHGDHSSPMIVAVIRTRRNQSRRSNRAGTLEQLRVVIERRIDRACNRCGMGLAAPVPWTTSRRSGVTWSYFLRLEMSLLVFLVFLVLFLLFLFHLLLLFLFFLFFRFMLFLLLIHFILFLFFPYFIFSSSSSLTHDTLYYSYLSQSSYSCSTYSSSPSYSPYSSEFSYSCYSSYSGAQVKGGCMVLKHPHPKKVFP